MHLFNTPTAPNEFAGEPIEKLRIARSLALRAEIVWRRDNAPTEMVLPDAIDHYTSRELASAVIDISNPICKRAATVGCRAAGRRFDLPFLFLFR